MPDGGTFLRGQPEIRNLQRMTVRTTLLHLTAGLGLWLSVVLLFSAADMADRMYRGLELDIGRTLFAYAYGYAGWILLAPAVHRAGVSLKPNRTGLVVAGGAIALIGVLASLYCYALITGYFLWGLGPKEVFLHYPFPVWIWDICLFGLIFIRSLLFRPPVDATPLSPSLARIAVKSPDHVEFVDTDLIQGISAQGNYALLILEGRSLLHRETLSSLAVRLASSGFIRIHRSHLVNPRFITSASARGDHVRAVRLDSGSELPVSTRYSAGVAEAFKRMSR